MSSPGAVERTAIPGLLVVRVDVHRDERGWFKENWHRRRLAELGLPPFTPVQHNVAFNHRRGVTRGVHAEPWDKLVSVATGRVFGAWVDLRAGETFGTVVHREIHPGLAVLVPRGVGNAYQALEDGTAYTYLVNGHWQPGQDYPAVAPGDPALAIPWPVPLADAELSEKDLRAPGLDQLRPGSSPRIAVIGADGQVGQALLGTFPHARPIGQRELDLGAEEAVRAWPWQEHDIVVNAAAHTAVDAAETPEGRVAAWAVNAVGPALLAREAAQAGFTLVHYSTDYVFDGTSDAPAGVPEDAPIAPLSVYGQSKAAGDLAVRAAPRHYVLRTSWVVGSGANFVRTMVRIADTGGCPAVVADQVGRLTFADELAAATRHLVECGAPFGVYHVSGDGPEQSWCDVARRVFALRGRDPGDVRAVTTDQYAAGAGPLAARPRRSTLDLSRLRDTGFVWSDQDRQLERLVHSIKAADQAEER